MKCPKCGYTTKVFDNSFNEKKNELYRHRRCEYCDQTFYTVEKIMVDCDSNKEKFWKNHRSAKFKETQALKKMLNSEKVRRLLK